MVVVILWLFTDGSCDLLYNKQCQDSSVCYYEAWDICDGFVDCPNGEDEAYENCLCRSKSKEIA